MLLGEDDQDNLMLLFLTDLDKLFDNDNLQSVENFFKSNTLNREWGNHIMRYGKQSGYI
jgi:hypothetical protein